MTVLGRCQTSQAMGIFYDLFDEGEKGKAFEVLLKLIEENDGLMDVGVVGARVLFNVLSRFGRTDLAYEMITTERYPSYGGWVRAGATSLWEVFHPTDRYYASHNHHFWGHISGWMYENIAGICFNPYGDDIRRVNIQPRFVDALDSAKASHVAPYGRIASEWKRNGEEITLAVEIPEECSGKITLETGWQFEDGYRVKNAESGIYRIIPAKSRSTLYYG